jgi:hypothetical protein
MTTHVRPYRHSTGHFSRHRCATVPLAAAAAPLLPSAWRSSTATKMATAGYVRPGPGVGEVAEPARALARSPGASCNSYLPHCHPEDARQGGAV